MADKYYVDNECKQVYTMHMQLVGHYTQVHKGIKPPKKDECEIDEIPEGYEVIPPPPGTKEKGKEKVKAPTPKLEGTKLIPAGITTPDAAERLGEILDTYGVEDEIIDRIKRIFHLDSSLQSNPQNLETVLKTWIPKPLHNLLTMIIAQFLGTPGQAQQPVYYPYGQQPYNPLGSYYPGYQPQYMPPGQQPFFMPPYQPATASKELDDRFASIEKTLQTLSETVIGKEQDKQSAATDERFAKLEGMVGDLISQLTQTEAEKKEQALLAKISSLEEKIVVIGSQPRTEESGGKVAETLAAIQKEMSDMKATASQQLITRLEGEIANLRSQVGQVQQERIGHLEAELEDAKKRAGVQQPVGRTEMDVVASLGEKAIEGVKEVGRDVRTIMMSPEVQRRFMPTRTTPAQRAQVGEQIARVVEQEAQTATLENQLLTQPEPTKTPRVI